MKINDNTEASENKTNNNESSIINNSNINFYGTVVNHIYNSPPISQRINDNQTDKMFIDSNFISD
jgi:hypothetical protein